MKNIQLKEEVNYSCDTCNKDFQKKFVSFDMIDDMQMRIVEMKPQTLNNHYTYWRKTLDFCSTDCAIKFLNQEMLIFIKEITAINRK